MILIDRFNWSKETDGSWVGISKVNVTKETAKEMPSEYTVLGKTRKETFYKLETHTGRIVYHDSLYMIYIAWDIKD